MSKRAEEKALEVYPVLIDPTAQDCDMNECTRGLFQDGYEQAEKDLALTWEDIREIINIHTFYSCEWKHHPYNSKEYFEEVLRRFNEKSGE